MDGRRGSVLPRGRECLWTGTSVLAVRDEGGLSRPPETRGVQRVATFVLVHGAMHGGWCWSDVGRRLAQHGHDVHRPTLTGQGTAGPR